jgi:mRNA-degrading endonuclease RelE of RelBE toxin-antitoxin system
MSINGLKEYKKYLIGTITPENKKEINRLTRQIDKQIKELLNENNTNYTNSIYRAT